MSAPVSPVNAPANGVMTQEAFNTLKRKYDLLVRKSGKNRRGPNSPGTTEERARGICKIASLYTNVSSLVTVALAREEGGDDSDTDEAMPEEEQRRLKAE
jgi:hypothetical protein